YNTTLKMFIGISYYPDGFGLAASLDGVTGWQRISNKILLNPGTFWNRGSNSSELVEYPSLIGLDGDSSSIGSEFWLYYMQINPGETIDPNRHLVRRKVQISQNPPPYGTPLAPQIALNRYQSTNSPDTWVTTANPSSQYKMVETLGYLFTVQPSTNAQPIFDCYLSQEKDHMLDILANCGNPNVINLRQMGWLSSAPFPNSRQIYRCFDPATLNHFVSADSNCEGKSTEWLIGYVAQPFPVPVLNNPVYKNILSDFYNVWKQSDLAIANGQSNKSWLWGPDAFATKTEDYKEATGGKRQVQYFDKARMEINNPDGDKSSAYFVTNGLLPKELIGGYIQTGDSTNQPKAPAEVNVAGDPDGSITYAKLAGVVTLEQGKNTASDRTGQKVTASIDRTGNVSDGAALAGVTLAQFIPETGHNLPNVFVNYFKTLPQDWLFVMGYPISEPY
ncbi:MAG: hypothetical protein WCS37_22600, partial [Chloroflexota bacterium]